jgi:hypothetical protein
MPSGGIWPGRVTWASSGHSLLDRASFPERRTHSKNTTNTEVHFDALFDALVTTGVPSQLSSVVSLEAASAHATNTNQVRQKGKRERPAAGRPCTVPYQRRHALPVSTLHTVLPTPLAAGARASMDRACSSRASQPSQ